MFRLRMIGKILKQAQLGPVSLAYAIAFFVIALLIAVLNPQVGGFGNAVWLCFETATTVGFGDISTQGAAVRVLLAVISVLSLFYLAIITGAVVSYCTEMMRARNKESLSRVIDDLEHLEEKTPEELRDISRRARIFRLK